MVREKKSKSLKKEGLNKKAWIYYLKVKLIFTYVPTIFKGLIFVINVTLNINYSTAESK